MKKIKDLYGCEISTKPKYCRYCGKKRLFKFKHDRFSETNGKEIVEVHSYCKRNILQLIFEIFSHDSHIGDFYADDPNLKLFKTE